MKASLRWIQEFVDLPTKDPEEIARVLSLLGLEVESYETLEVPFEGVKVARTLSIDPHPDADRIRVVTIDAGAEPITLVCGAWNFEQGDTVAYATVGSVLAGGFEVGEREIRGVMSPGMIASEKELGIGEDADGILVLDEGEPGDDFGAMLAYPDTIFDLSITPNRPDAMSIYGVARDLAAWYGVEVAHPDPMVTATGKPSGAKVRIEAPAQCHRFTARELRGVTIGPSPLWMRLRLDAVGVRPISNVVDVTNYVMIEYGQPLHAFDLDEIPEETIVVRTAREEETLRTLDGVDRHLTTDDLVIAGPDKALGLAGIMGGEETEVSDDTTRILLEVAHFDPPGILLTGKRLGIRSEAVSRFERGVDPALPPKASARAAALLVKLAGAEVADGFIDEHPTKRSAPTITLPAGEAKRLLGMDIPLGDQAGYLRRLGMGVEENGDLRVTVPSYRPDVSRAADLVEEIVRVHGYDKVPATLPFGVGGEVPEWLRGERRVREMLAGSGHHEVWNYDFLGMEDLERLRLPDEDPRLDPVPVRNPLSEEEGFLRTTLLPGLLAGLGLNHARNIEEVALFEIGAVFLRSDDELPGQPRRVGFAAVGDGIDATHATGVVQMLFDALHQDVSLMQEQVPGLHPGRGARVFVGDDDVGFVGEAHPAAAEAFGIRGRVAVGEIALDALTRGPIAVEVPSAMPPVVFDLAFDLPEPTPVAEALSILRASGGDLLENVTVFDVFRGAPLSSGRKSVAFRLTFRHPDRTLVDEELVPVRDEIARQMASALDGRLRGG